MKKTYQQPHIVVITVASQRMIAASGESMTFSEESANSSTVVDVKQSGYSVWDDDWSR